MTYEEFKDALVEKVNVRLEGSSIKAELKAVTKNNNVVKEGLVFIESGSNASPVIYLDGAYLWYQESNDMNSVVTRVLQLLDERLEIDINSIVSAWEVAKERISIRVLNYEWNKGKFKGIPHKKLLDLAIVPVLTIDLNSDGSGTTFVNEYFLQNWGIDEETLWEAANGWLEKEEFEYKGLMDLLRDMVGEIDESMEVKFRLYFFGNQTRTYGAAAILRTDILEKFSEEIDGNFYIIPSSIHELLLLPDRGMDENDDAELKEMIEMVNDQQVSCEERLSYNLYYYDKETKKVEIR